MPSKHKFRFDGEGDHEPGKEPGDVVIQLEEKPHELFQRHGIDISMRMDILLSESLCGFKKIIKTLDNRDIIIHTKPGEIIKHGALKVVNEEGFPKYKDPFNKGRLIICFNVVFPESLTEDAAKKIASSLPRAPKVTIPPSAEEVSLAEFDGTGKWGGEEAAGNGDDDDQEYEGASNGPRMNAQSCQQQ